MMTIEPMDNAEINNSSEFTFAEGSIPSLTSSRLMMTIESMDTAEINNSSEFTFAEGSIPSLTSSQLMMTTEPIDTAEINNSSEFTLAEGSIPSLTSSRLMMTTEPMDTAEINNSSEFTLAEGSIPSLTSSRLMMTTEPMDTAEINNSSEFTLAEGSIPSLTSSRLMMTTEPMDTAEINNSSEFTLAEGSIPSLTSSRLMMMTTEPMDTAEINNSSEFTLAEALEMEMLYKKRGKELLQQKLCEEIATKFSSSANRNQKSIITWNQVHTWFVDRQLFSAVKSKSSVADSVEVTKKLAFINSSPNALKNLIALSKAWAEAEKPTKPKAQRVEELSDLMFEALSAKDCAWYDVAIFLNFRVMYTGELEVRVRFSGFSNDHDEWVNVRKGLRERSIPLVPSECHKVKVDDLVLCYRANDDHALYSDAHVTRVERQLHDTDNCTCKFTVRFEYDNAEMDVQCSEICRRPS